MEIRAHRQHIYAGDNIEIYLFQRDQNTQCIKSIVTDLVLTTVEENSFVERRPTVTIDDNAAQILMDTLWDCGIRPSEGTGSSGSLAATERHLNDMRAIVSRKLGVELKGEKK